MAEKIIQLQQVDVFTKEVNQGNPAGVLLVENELTEDEMQLIAKKVGFNETVFILPSQLADYRLRYFTPGHETPLCGHATLGAVHYLSELGKVEQQLTIETGVGVLKITIDENQQIVMEQDTLKQVAFKQSKAALCTVLGIETTDLEETLPIEYGNTGSWTLLVPVKSKAVLAKMQPLTAEFPDVLKEMPRSSIHPFAIIDKEKQEFVARHFSSPFSGTIEDSVTGTASGVMGAYFQQYLYPNEKSLTVTIYQGEFIGKAGEVKVFIAEKNGEQLVKIAGTAVMNPQELKISY
ncbi:trans-2,3-dihydro-3-hydroxyanthranilate isomerase [Enterococcus sp. PF1-24]|uniref:PhzF family phenazine biosynthesis protein n=1 Tax=unclassified Enterococcus TaxID=2608891 RepID=UPI002477148E|nr:MULTISPECIES: PhzF family phenazine biosynthesis protein [unclassified Enterococcus]MDH6365026.1 trans-2,3-dihydro-3-hydroxyanthranilate isomerase [Enterococcus sp. PFB1-1]MDH6402127.1 trans-2,3-dihydro-3-hydroxyanthranilate isomerase [Enterococcus sp. PF1-24]